MDDRGVIYPTQLYELVYSSTVALCVHPDQDNLGGLKHRITSGEWLIGEMTSTKISTETYIWLWRSVVACVKYKKVEFLYSLWESNTRHFTYKLSTIYPEYNDEGVITNQSVIDSRDKERESFLEFHYVLGGLLIKEREFECLNRFFHFTQSTPAEYPLLPSIMDQVFEWYVRFNDPYDINLRSFEYRYYFPDSHSIDAKEYVTKEVRRYIVLLYLRQFTIGGGYGKRPTEKPDFPNSQAGKHDWGKALEQFEFQLLEMKSDKELLEKFNLLHLFVE
ncbi:MAG TPA: hypothetical protein VFV37_01575 [Luteibaculaceae bacterium]|nr:hypothetical protein [Luteibaculaceae bacterium]